MSRIAVFTWLGHLPDDDEVDCDPETRYSGDFGEQWDYQATQPVAVAVQDAVREAGHTVDVERPYYGEHGWHFGVQLDQEQFSIRVQWIVRDNNEDAFAVEPTLRRGCLAGLLLPRPADAALDPIRGVLNDVLSVHPSIANLQWVNEIP